MDDALDAAALEIARLAELAQKELDALLAENRVTVAAVLGIQHRFNEAFLQVMARQLNVAPGGNVWDVRQVGAMRVDGMTLSRRLYKAAGDTAREVAGIVREHAAGVQQARALALRLYDGYDPKDGIKRPLEGRARAELPKALRELTANAADRASLQRVYEQGMRYAGTLKTEPLKAAYMEAFRGWQQQQGLDALRRRLEVAHKEKTRFMANRIAQTELARAHQHALGAELMADDTTTVVQVLMSASHPRADICDVHARADLFRLGPGCYPKERAPRPPFHPFCRCRLRSRPDLAHVTPRAVPGGEAAFLRAQPVSEAARMAGSRDKLQEVLDGKPLLDVVNRSAPDGYKTVRLGEVTGHPLVKAAPVERQNARMSEAYEVARSGGANAGLLTRYGDESDRQIEKAIRSLEKRILEHLDKIARPADHVEPGTSDQKISYLVGSYWPKEIAGYRREADVLRGILQDAQEWEMM